MKFSLFQNEVHKLKSNKWRDLYLKLLKHYEIEKILEIGAGSPEFLVNVNAKEKIAFDGGAKFKNELEKNKITFLEIDLDYDEFPKIANLDVVICSDVFEHLIYPKKSLDFAEKALKNNGDYFPGFIQIYPEGSAQRNMDNHEDYDKLIFFTKNLSFDKKADKLSDIKDRIISKVIPVILISICKDVMPSLVPATLKSISPKWSSSPKMSDKTENFSPSLIKPIAMPATGSLIGTPASISDKDVPHTVAIEEDPFDSVISETTLKV